jgi:lysophospholipase L1-like esterase
MVKLAYLVLGVIAVVALCVVAFAQVNRPVEAKAGPIPTFTSAPSSTAHVLARPTDRPLGVVFAGDSLTYGLYASAEDKGYRPLTVAALEKGGAVAWSRGGQTGNKIQTVTDSINFPATTDVAILELGTNDVWKTPAADIRAQYDVLMGKVKASAPSARIICLGVWSGPDGRRNYDAPIQASCEAGGGQFISLGTAYDAADTRGPAGRETFGGVSDDFHPNDNGYRLIAERVVAALGLSL